MATKKEATTEDVQTEEVQDSKTQITPELYATRVRNCKTILRYRDSNGPNAKQILGTAKFWLQADPELTLFDELLTNLKSLEHSIERHRIDMKIAELQALGIDTSSLKMG